MVQSYCFSQIIRMRKPRYIYHSISSNSGTARQEQAQVQELQATQAQRAIAKASLQIPPKSCIYCALLALILNYLPFKIRNTSTRAGTAATTHTPRTLPNTSGSARKHVLANVTQQSLVCTRVDWKHKETSFSKILLSVVYHIARQVST